MNIRSTTPLQSRRGDPRGQVLVLFALVLVVLLLVSALAVDYGGWLVAKRNYQNISDAASLAGAQQLTRPALGATQQFNARQAAWESVKRTLNLGLNPIALALASRDESQAWTENGYSIWVASPPSDAGSAYLGHVSGPGNVYVRIEHDGQMFLSGVTSVMQGGKITKKVTAWSTAGRFPANFAVIALCQSNCLAQDANIKLDGTGTNLIVDTGDLGTNTWVKTGGNSSGLALGADSNGFMEDFDTCWGYAGNQCQEWGSLGGAPDTSTTRSAIPLGAPIVDPTYPAPPINATATPNECRGTGTVQLASVQVLEGGDDSQGTVADLPIALAAAYAPITAPQAQNLAATNNDLAGIVKSLVGNAPLGNINVSATNGTTTYNMGATPNNGGNKGKYSQANLNSGTYTITATDPSGVYHAATATVTIPTPGTNTTYTPNPDILMQKNPTISGTIRSSAGGVVANAAVSITGSGGPYNTTASAAGAYGPVIITGWGATNTWNVNASATNYTSNFTTSGFLALDQTYVIDVTLTPAPATLTVNVTDQVTGLALPNVTVTLTGGSTGSLVTNTAGSVTFGSVNIGSTTVTLTAADLSGYVTGSPSNLQNPSTISIAAGSNTANFALWPKGCGTANGDKGDWSCSLPSGSNCPAPTNVNAANVSCAFTQANAIRPGTYTDITIPSGTCAWFDPKGGLSGLAANQYAGIYHIKGTIDIGNGAYLFGDGITIVMDQGSNIDVGNGGGFVLNYGTHKVSATAGVCDPAQGDFTTRYAYLDTGEKCFRTVTGSGTQDYAYAAWTTKGHIPWTSGTFPTYDDSTVQKGQELGMTWYMYGSGRGNASRMKLSTANMGYLFNGVLYAPNDDIQLGGGKDGQSAAGQLVGWTIEYHGGTQIIQNWYGDPVDGPPFLIEPILGE